jgi:hypothetical protein
MTAKTVFLSFFLLSLILQADAQYRRRGETLQSPGNKTASKKASYSLAQLQGKWQEYQRKSRSDSTTVDFRDSIQLIFSDSNKVETRTSAITSMNLKGEADIDVDNTLTVAADQYTIKSLSSTQLVLDDNEQFVHILKKVDSFWYEKLGRLTVKKNDYSNPVKASIPGIIGKWAVYRRQAKPGSVDTDELLIKNLNITTKKDEHSATGTILFYQGDNSQQLPCLVTLHGSDIKIVAGQRVWNLSVYQSDTDNFVFGSEALLYFAKPAR